jgi:hypothetical protein
MSTYALPPTTRPPLVRDQPMPTRRRTKRKRNLVEIAALVGVCTIAFNQWRVANYTPSDFIFTLTGGLVFAQLLAGVRRGIAPTHLRRSSPVVLAGSLLILTAGAISTMWSSDPLSSVSVMVRLAWITIFWFWLLRALSPDSDTFDALLRMVRVGALVNCAIAVLTHVGVIPTGTGPFAADASGRQSGLFDHANGLAGFLLMALPLFLLDVPHKSPNVLRRVGTSGLVLFTMLLTGSMTATAAAIIGFAAMLLVMALGPPQDRFHLRPSRLVMIAVVMLIALGLVAQGNISVIERFQSRGQDSGINASVSFREAGFKAMVDHLDEHLLVGTGFDQREAGLELGIPGWVEATTSGLHSMFLKMIFEAGLVAAAGLLLILVHTLRQAFQTATRDPDRHARRVSAALFASVTSLVFLAQFQPVGFERFFWLPVGFIGVHWSLRRDAAMRRRVAAVVGLDRTDAAVELDAVDTQVPGTTG